MIEGLNLPDLQYSTDGKPNIIIAEEYFEASLLLYYPQGGKVSIIPRKGVIHAAG